jgi:hypothetical protein
MIKKKKKLSYSEQQKQQKLQQAQYKNLFVQKLQELCVAIGDASLFDLIPPDEVDFIYSIRTAPLKIKAAKGAKIQKRLIEVMEKKIKQLVNRITIELIPGSKRTVSLTDYAIVGEILERTLTDDESPIRQKERFDEFLAHKKERTDYYYSHIFNVCDSICDMYNDISSHNGLYIFRFDRYYGANELNDRINMIKDINATPNGRTKGWQLFKNTDTRQHPTITISVMPLDVKQVQLDGENRPAIELALTYYQAWDDPQLDRAYIPLSKLDASKALGDLQLPVYIQQHALHRLAERIGCLIPSYTLLHLNIAITELEITMLNAGRFLIAYHLNTFKLGYLLCEVLHDYVLIRTFLFITNSGTPEGDKLAAITNLQKEDCKYLAIDNLPSLLGSDILKNEAISKIFRQAGCQPILDLCQDVQETSFLKGLIGIKEQKTSLSELMMEYLNPQADNDEYVIGE